jgi:hypothetical protein
MRFDLYMLRPGGHVARRIHERDRHVVGGVHLWRGAAAHCTRGVCHDTPPASGPHVRDARPAQDALRGVRIYPGHPPLHLTTCIVYCIKEVVQLTMQSDVCGNNTSIRQRQQCTMWVPADTYWHTHREKFIGGPSDSVTRKELGALFDVIGTPTWGEVDGVQSDTWRSYLQKLPGRAPTLYRRLGLAGGLLEQQSIFVPRHLSLALSSGAIFSSLWLLHVHGKCSFLKCNGVKAVCDAGLPALVGGMQQARRPCICWGACWPLTR